MIIELEIDDKTKALLDDIKKRCEKTVYFEFSYRAIIQMLIEKYCNEEYKKKQENLSLPYRMED